MTKIVDVEVRRREFFDRLQYKTTKALTRFERNGSHRTKVFIRRAVRCGWTEQSIVAAIKFGFHNFYIPKRNKE